jgi:hypothetical protein
MKHEKMTEIETEMKGMILAIIFMSILVLILFSLAPYF